jgi:hypothetical protein
MKRRNFIKNTGLTIAGLAFSKAIYSKNNSAKKSLHLFILMSGGIQYNDIIKANKNEFSILFQENSSWQVSCKTNVKYTGNEMEHTPAMWAILSQFNNQNNRNIFIGNASAETTKFLSDAHWKGEIISPSTSSIYYPYCNDAAIFDLANQNLNSNDNSTIILNLEDSDIAHYSPEAYYEVLKLYNQKIEALCNKVFTKQFNQKYDVKLTVASALGRNNSKNEIAEMGGTDHYHVSARDLFCFEAKYEEQTSINFDHQNYDSSEMWGFHEVNVI